MKQIQSTQNTIHSFSVFVSFTNDLQWIKTLNRLSAIKDYLLNLLMSRNIRIQYHEKYLYVFIN